MNDPLNQLTVIHDNNGVFVDHSSIADDYIRDNFSVDLVASEDYLYIGFSKPFSSTYVKLDVANINPNTLTMEYYDGTTWQSRSIDDETQGLTRSGFILWDRSDMSSVSVDGKSAYYIRLRSSADHSATQIRAINLVFADDNALKQEFFEIDNSSLLPAGETDHIVHHVAARNTIIQRLRNHQYIKIDSDNNTINLTHWDLFDLFEIKQAAVMLALSKIFFILSDSQEDNWWTKYREYQDKYEEAFNLARISLDTDNDGVKDDNEVLVKTKVQRWQR